MAEDQEPTEAGQTDCLVVRIMTPTGPIDVDIAQPEGLDALTGAQRRLVGSMLRTSALSAQSDMPDVMRLKALELFPDEVEFTDDDMSEIVGDTDGHAPGCDCAERESVVAAFRTELHASLDRRYGSSPRLWQAGEIMGMLGDDAPVRMEGEEAEGFIEMTIEHLQAELAIRRSRRAGDRSQGLDAARFAGLGEGLGRLFESGLLQNLFESVAPASDDVDEAPDEQPGDQ